MPVKYAGAALETRACKTCTRPVTDAVSLADERAGDSIVLDAQVQTDTPSRKQYIIAAVAPATNELRQAVYVVRWNDTPENRDEPRFREHRCQRR